MFSAIAAVPWPDEEAAVLGLAIRLLRIDPLPGDDGGCCACGILHRRSECPEIGGERVFPTGTAVPLANRLILVVT